MLVVSSDRPNKNTCNAHRETEIEVSWIANAVLKPSVDERGTTTLSLLQRLQLLAGLETHSLARRDGHLCASAGIAADTRLARANVEDPEATQFNALPVRQGQIGRTSCRERV